MQTLQRDAVPLYKRKCPCKLCGDKQHPCLKASSASMPLVRELDNFVISHPETEARSRVYTE